jgi:hypothetical protein
MDENNNDNQIDNNELETESSDISGPSDFDEEISEKETDKENKS